MRGRKVLLLTGWAVVALLLWFALRPSQPPVQNAFAAFGVEPGSIPSYEVAEVIKDTPELLHVQIQGGEWTLDQCKQVLADFIDKNRNQHAAITARIFGNPGTGEVVAYYFRDEDTAAQYQAMLQDVKVRQPDEGYPAFVLIYHE